MKISSTGKNIGGKLTATPAKINKSKDFSTMLDMTKKQQQEYQVNQMIKKIKDAGERVKETLSVVDVNVYKQYIADFLKFVLGHCYSVSHAHGYQGVLSRVEIVNKELEELTRELLEEQKNTIAIARRIDGITGLLIDLHS
ncbi:YaaR family protein [Desulfoscipio geothermicus]|uniref:DUF327 domain-containing protein n=1 Tax=Desulfoscipio geothermicus DSM 3669 TaxID=1121426 RepID=A0A1I6CRM9_9FIRM|nr:YaaR family protein [Desulfoscipio geothermicus]SFQ95802.1 hypothetical protein SAMN05660706_101253 [Desulfoscipio geothermicus DSM 3669]